ncbi:unnamed protein product [Mytilus coruscus]|uniref:TPM domain-containing protein n=1 Tax=Mytilus coruscus TaxID=42192 RepID=A0A6J8C2U8_MYTCO|nr:unnamed protein product [Mytilus coruscus]
MILILWEDILTRCSYIKKKSGYGLIKFFPVIICVLLIQQGYCSQCPSPDCLSGYYPSAIPNPSTQSGLCGRFCHSTWICDPCQILNSAAADEIDRLLDDVPADSALCGSVRTYRISLAVVNRMDSGGQTSDAKNFANYLRKTGWNFETGSCGNNVVIFLSRYDRQVYTSAGKAAFKVLNEECIDGIFKEAKEDYFSADDFEGGLKFMVQEYKKALKEGECSYDSNKWIIWAVPLITVTIAVVL